MCGSRRRGGFGGCSRRGPPRYSPVGMLIRHISEKRDAKNGFQQQPYGYGYEPEKQSYAYDDMRANQQSFGNEKMYGQGQRGVPILWVDENQGQRMANTQSLEEKEAADLAEAIRQSLGGGLSTEQLPSYGQVMKQ
ncbi:uncharacterized protein K444DRAFT_613452 [Hyaloscypha bicolor E]|uniref:Uncharacterized protein n=1 Tax=Hyaloscypha bicolor E TaxID=1095630 RepID=A0A2J6T8Z3_9HELO|nr:uncharacterized protein K444DRAFT_613452 [Hyaloscypha bicolor E]PMD59495.1 hypothetical protein K444DRAFT_613452 [Hyaloscypha bicolor E]